MKNKGKNMKTKISFKQTPDNKNKPWRFENPSDIVYYETEQEAIKAQQVYLKLVNG